MLAFAPGLRVGAEPFTVTTTNDSGPGSLRQAILDLNAAEDASNTILFTLPDDSVITLDSVLPDIEFNVTIDPVDLTSLTIRGFDADETFIRTDTASVTFSNVLLEEGVVEIGLMNRFILDTSDDMEIGVDLIDSSVPIPPVDGELVKNGSATLTLSGTNDYSGGTTINGGVLRGDTTSLQGNIRNDATLIFDLLDDTDPDLTYGGNISGTGDLEKAGTHTVTFSGDHTYSGDTLVSEGKLIFTGSPSTTSDIEIATDATLELDPATAFTLNGELNGDGTLVKGSTNLDADVVLSGGGEFTGLTQIEGGRLTDASGVIVGDVEFGAGMTPALAFQVSSSQTHSGTISGTGDVIKAGFGTLTLLGNNSYTGGTFIDAGTLIGTSSSLPGDIESGVFGGSLIFDQSFTGTFSGDISRASGALFELSLEKRGSGLLKMTGDVVALAGTAITQGILEIDGQFISPTISIDAPAALGGVGDVFGFIDARGVISPGPQGQIGTLRITDVEFQGGSFFEVHINESNAGDSLIVAEAADLSDGLVRVVALPGNYAGLSEVTILEADTIIASLPNPGLNGTEFIGFEADFAFLDENLIYDHSADLETVKLTIIANGKEISEFAETANQLTVAEVLDLEAPVASGDMLTVFNNIRVMFVEEVAPMLDAIGGESLSAFPTAQIAVSERFERRVHRRLRDVAWREMEAFKMVQSVGPAPLRLSQWRSLSLPTATGPSARWGSSSTQRGASGRPFIPFEGETGVGGWIDGWGLSGDLDGDGNSADVEYTGYGATLGVDYSFTDRIIAGLAGGYAHTDIDLKGRDTEGDLDTAQGALYAGYVDPRYHVSASGHYGFGWNDSARRIAFSGFDKTAKASFDSQDIGARAEFGLSALKVGPVAFVPLAAIDWDRYQRDAFTESGADSLDLVVDSADTTSLVSSLGGSLRGLIDLEDEVSIRPELRLFWLHQFGDRDRVIRSRLQGAVLSSSFEIVGAEVPSDWLQAGVGLSGSLGDGVRVFLDYDVGIGDGLFQHELVASVRIHF